MINTIYYNILNVLRFSKRRTVALPSQHLWWLGINRRLASSLLLKEGVKTVVFGAEGTSTKLKYEEHDWSPLLKDALHYAVCVECESIAPDVESMFPEITAKWQRKISLIYSATKVQFKKQQPNLVVLLQGYEPLNAIARALAIELDIPMLALENTALSGRILWDNVSGITTNRNLAKNYYWKYRDSIPPDDLRAFDSKVLQSLYDNKSEEHSSPQISPDISSNKPTVLFLGQVFTDSSMVFGLKGWNSPLDILKALATWCSNNNHQLIVKLHPKEATGCDPITERPYERLTYRKITADTSLCKKLDALNALIDADNNYDTYSLIKGCSFAVTVNSQSGLEAALFNKAVIVCGHSFYSGLGLTLDATEPELLPRQLENAKQGWLPSNALEFSYIFFERYCRDKTVDGLIKLINKYCT